MMQVLSHCELQSLTSREARHTHARIKRVLLISVCVTRLYLTVDLCLLFSLHSGTDRESPNNVEKPPNRKPPVKKPRLPQNRNKSLDLSGTCLCFLFVCVCLCARDQLQSVTVCVCVCFAIMRNYNYCPYSFEHNYDTVAAFLCVSLFRALVDVCVAHS